jgi:hypothetical protein
MELSRAWNIKDVRIGRISSNGLVAYRLRMMTVGCLLGILISTDP